MDMEDHGLYLIGGAAEATGLSVKAIRHYEKIGLIPRPRQHDGNARTGGNRLYTELDLARLRFVRQARHPDYRRILTCRMETATHRIAQLSDLQTRLTTLVSKYGSGHIQRCSGDDCGCLDADPDPRRKPAGGEANADRVRQRKGRDPGSP